MAIGVMSRRVSILLKTVARLQDSNACRWENLGTGDRQANILGDGDFVVDAKHIQQLP